MLNIQSLERREKEEEMKLYFVFLKKKERKKTVGTFAYLNKQHGRVT